MPNRKVIIRVDGNSSIGLGHIYRGIALAEMLKEEFAVEFITKENTTISPIKKSEFNYTYIPKIVVLSEEPIWIKKNYPINTIVVLDGYGFTEDYQQKIKDANFKLVYIDDLVQGTQKADLVINHSPGINESDYKTEPYTLLALGIDYGILRPTFLNVAKQERNITKIDTAFVCFGGSDIYDLTLKSTFALLMVNQLKKINIVIGGAYKHTKIFEIQKEYPKINIYQDLCEQELLSVMKDSNFAIAPASTILFELLAVRTPVLSGYYAENQRMFYTYLKSNNIILGVDNFNTINKIIIGDAIKQIENNNFIFPKIIDGKQKERIIKLIKSLNYGYKT